MLPSQLSCLCTLCTRLEPRTCSAAQEQPAPAGIQTFSDSFTQNPKIWGASLLSKATSSISPRAAAGHGARLGCPGISCKWGLAPQACSQGYQVGVTCVTNALCWALSSCHRSCPRPILPERRGAYLAGNSNQISDLELGVFFGFY